MIYFTADLHFDHKNIIQHTERPFENVEEMNRVLIKNWNDTVKPKDTIYIIGDLTLVTKRVYIEELVGKLNGIKHLIIGNHDRFAKKAWASSLFESISDYKEIHLDNKHVCLMHYPIAHWNRQHYGSYHLHGHVHRVELDYIKGNRYNVGVDQNDFRPVSWETIRSKFIFDGSADS